MERLNESRVPAAAWLIITGLILLLAGMLFGILGAVQYVLPGWLKEVLSFEKVRPLHVSSVIFWIMLAAMGSVLLFVQEHTGRKLSLSLLRLQLILFISAIVLILGCYFLGLFGGREYWEFPPVLAILVLGGWLMFAISVVRSLWPLQAQQPVYVWMWITGALGFLITYTESYLWVFSYFHGNIVRDLAVQWKSYGSMVGCWNMLIYGIGIYLMEKISQDRSYARSGMAFTLYFLGLINMMFNWSHHIYTLPFSKYIQYVGYMVSMTELFILGRIIYKWKESLTTAQKFSHLLPYRFMITADLWILLNLILAIIMSVPAMNVYTHGTHITVAHSMGTTIGINTMLLLAAAFELLGNQKRLQPFQPRIILSLRLVNVSLFVFFTSLILAGIQRSRWQMGHDPQAFAQMMYSLKSYFITLAIAGALIFTGFSSIIYHLLAKGSLNRTSPETKN